MSRTAPSDMQQHDPYLTNPSMIRKAVSSPEHPVWNRLIVFYQPFITKILRYMGFKEPELDDVMQVVNLKLWKNLPLYVRDTEKAKFRSWLARLVKNSAIDWIRSQKKDRHCDFYENIHRAEYSVENSKLESLIETEWQAYIVSTAITRLDGVFTGQAIEVLKLSLEGVSCEEISERLSMRKESVYVLRSRVKKRVEEEISSIRAEFEGGFSNGK